MPKIVVQIRRTPFLKPEEVNNGDIITINEEGRHVDDKWGHNRLQMEILLPNEEVRMMTVNQTSQKNIATRYGNDTIKWVSKQMVIKKERMFIAGQNKLVLILEPK